MKPTPVLTDEERFPLIKQLGFLNELRQDSCGPKFNFKSGDRLNNESLQEVQKYAQNIGKTRFWDPGKTPDWMPGFLKWCTETVPAYKNCSMTLENNSTLNRESLAECPWDYVSDDCQLEDLLVYSTSGTTGKAMDVLFDATSQAKWIPQLESILHNDGIFIEGGPERVSICLVCCQEETLTYASLSTYLNGAGVLKINLNSKEWNQESDPALYLEKHNPEIITGDPFTFLKLAEIAPQIRPKALVSSAMTLNEGLRTKLANTFLCPVYDIYSLTECRMIAVSLKQGIHRLFRPDLFVEILHPDKDEPVTSGERGEIVVTSGINPFLPLIRYRTGDYGVLKHVGDSIEIHDFEGRAPTIFFDDKGQFVNHVDVSRAISEFALAGFTLHQQKDHSIEFHGWGPVSYSPKVKQQLIKLFGKKIQIKLRIHNNVIPDGKKIQYSSEFSETDIYK